MSMYVYVKVMTVVISAYEHSYVDNVDNVHIVDKIYHS